MFAPIWVIVYDWDGLQRTILRYTSDSEVAACVYHNTYYHRPCLVVRVKEWK